MGTQKDIYNVLYDKDRELTKIEYSNLRSKQIKSCMNANFFRRNMFNATSRGSRIQYVRPKIVWEYSDGKSVAVSHSLHQRHADVLSLIHSDYSSMTKPSKDGSYDIYLSLYRIAKLMGYKDPHKRTDDVKQFINDLRWTDFIITTENGEYRNTILGRAYFDEGKDTFIVKVDGDSAKILTHTTGVSLSRKLTHSIVSIPNKYPKLKALVRFSLANKPTSHGYTLDFLFTKFGIGTTGNAQHRSNKKSLFRKELLENKELLASFNLIYSSHSSKIFYFEQLDDISFELSAPTSKVLDEIIVSSDDENTFKGSVITIDSIAYEILNVDYITDDVVNLELLNINTDKVGISKNVPIALVEKYVKITH